MQAIVAALAAQDAELDGLLEGLDAGDWTRPTPCEGWDVADVVLHVAQTDEFAVASVEGRVAGLPGAAAATSVDEAAGLAVAHQRGLAPAALLARWREAAAAQRQVLSACDPKRRVPWVIGEIPARTLATTRLSETWIHTTDVATALGAPVEASERLWHVARLAWRTLPYAFAVAGRELSGPVALELDGPGGERWSFGGDDDPSTVVLGDALEFCLVAGRRRAAGETGLTAKGPDADAVLQLVRTYA